MTGEIEESTYNKLFSDNPIINNITFVEYSSSVNSKMCSLENIQKSIEESKGSFNKRQISVEININDLLSQLSSLIGHTLDGKQGVSQSQPRGDDLLLCYLDNEYVVSCYCHETEKHFALACGSDVQAVYNNPGYIACAKDLRSTTKKYDHCDSGIYEDLDDAKHYIENKKKNSKKSKNWVWVLLIIIGCIAAVVILCILVLLIKKLSNSDWKLIGLDYFKSNKLS